ncbi:MAG: prephenate dehydrogenase [Firmicutes bacterium]|nr:prephenate dehydrogenase [Bacillota bacterium]
MIKIGIIGFGLIGGSIARALKARADVETVAMSRSEAPLKDGVSEGVLAAYSLDDFSIFAGCKYIFVCTPVDKIPEYVEKLLPVIDKDCIITDVGSTKYGIYRSMQAFDGIKFIAGHPMAGSEKTGFSAADEHLYENAYYILAPNENVTPAELEDFKGLVRLMGALPLEIDPKHHDHIVAAISHVPHIIASALAATVKQLDDDKELMHTIAAGGFKDTTRIAASSPEIWTSICFENRDEILKVADSFIEIFKRYRDDVANNAKDDFYARFEDAKNYRDTFSGKRGTDNYHTLRVDIVDEQGVLAKIVALLSLNGVDIKNIGITNSREYAGGVLQMDFDKKEHRDKGADVLKAAGYAVKE